MVVYLIAGLPAAGKDTLARILQTLTGHRLLSLSRDLLVPLQQDPSFVAHLSQKAGVNFSFFQAQAYPPGRGGLIQYADDLK